MPASCSMVQQWREKEEKDSVDNLWIKANTKPCPQCKNSIEKNDGCNHMTCRSCRYEFCWLCLANWNTHGDSTGGWYSCNLYEKKKQEDKEFAATIDSAEEAK